MLTAAQGVNGKKQMDHSHQQHASNPHASVAPESASTATAVTVSFFIAGQRPAFVSGSPFTPHMHVD
jgi:hypothetical protein